MIRPTASSSSRATVSPLVTTVTSSSSVRATRARAIAVVVLPTSTRTLIPGRTMPAAYVASRAFSVASVPEVSS